MSVSVSMPQLGESVTEGTVTRWLKKEGERVEVDEPLLEVSTDKVDTEIPSPASGILRAIAVDEDETVAVGAQLAVIEDSESSGSAPAPSAPPAQDDASAPQDAAAAAEPSQPEPVPAGTNGWSPPPSYPSPPRPRRPRAMLRRPPTGAAARPSYTEPPAYARPAAQSQPYAPPAAQEPAQPYAQARRAGLARPRLRLAPGPG